jgi:hypothetical protein
MVDNKKSMKRVILGFLALIVFLSTAIVSPIFAQTPPTTTWKDQTPQSFGGSLRGTDANLESSWHVGMQSSMYSLSCLGLGLACTDQIADIPGYIQRSAAGTLATAIDSTFTNRPADFGLWLADTGKTLGFLPSTAYAQGQGIGFTGLTPLLPIWKAFRNIAYLLMTVVIIVIGFLVMFRKKIDPKTVVTAQNAIPRVIIALILITFSYAIVGIMIDVMYIVLFFTIALFKQAGLQDPQLVWNDVFGIKTAQDLYGGGGLFANMTNIEANPWKLFIGIDSILGIPLGTGTDTILGLGGLIAAIAGFSSGNPAVGAIGIAGLTMPLIHLLITIAIIFLFIRLLVFFLSAYVQIIISLLLGPIQFLAEAFPGSNAFSSWFKNLVANLAVFPIGGAMFMLSALFTQFSNQPGSNLWVPPYTALGGNSVSIAALLALGVLFAIPNVAGSVKEGLKAKPAIGMGDGGGGLQSGMQMISTLFYLQQLTPKFIKERLPGGGGGGGGGGTHAG